MTMPKGRWLMRDRAVFIASLTETGDVRAATQAAGRCLVSAFRLRDAEPEFAQAWAQAIDHAWEVLEGALLGGLLQAAGALAAVTEPPAIEPNDDAEVKPAATATVAANPTTIKSVPRPAATKAAPRSAAMPDWKLVLAALAQRPRPVPRPRNGLATARSGLATARSRIDSPAVARLRAEIAALPRALNPASNDRRTGDATP